MTQAFDYPALKSAASDLLTTAGQTVKLVTPDRSISTKAVRIGVKREGQAIAEQAAYLIHGGVSTAPSVGHYIQVGSLSYRITAVEVTNPGGTTLLYKCLVE